MGTHVPHTAQYGPEFKPCDRDRSPAQRGKLTLDPVKWRNARRTISASYRVAMAE
jgi:hypothetical protein